MYTGHKIAIVADEAGTTRDISEYEYSDTEGDMTYVLSDSGGLDFSSDEHDINADIMERTKKSIEDSDLLIWVLEYDKFTQLDQDILKTLRTIKDVPFLLIANKADNENKQMESYSLA